MIQLCVKKKKGLKLNNDKTQVVWIGCKKNSKVRFLRDMNFCWDPGIFQALGIKFSTDTTRISSINFEGKISEIRKILNNWSRRQILPLGKITVVKTLVLPKLTHLFVSLLDLSGDFLKELDKMFFKFLWDGKQSKISKNVSVSCKKMED